MLIGSADGGVLAGAAVTGHAAGEGDDEGGVVARVVAADALLVFHLPEALVMGRARAGKGRNKIRCTLSERCMGNGLMV